MCDQGDPFDMRVHALFREQVARRPDLYSIVAPAADTRRPRSVGCTLRVSLPGLAFPLLFALHERTREQITLNWHLDHSAASHGWHASSVRTYFGLTDDHLVEMCSGQRSVSSNAGETSLRAFVECWCRTAERLLSERLGLMQPSSSGLPWSCLLLAVGLALLVYALTR